MEREYGETMYSTRYRITTQSTHSHCERRPQTQFLGSSPKGYPYSVHHRTDGKQHAHEKKLEVVGRPVDSISPLDPVQFQHISRAQPWHSVIIDFSVRTHIDRHPRLRINTRCDAAMRGRALRVRSASDLRAIARNKLRAKRRDAILTHLLTNQHTLATACHAI